MAPSALWSLSLGSGDNPYQHSGDFLSRVEELKKKGLSEKEILETINNSLPDEYKMGLTEFRTARQKAGHDRKALEYDQIRALKDDGLGWKEIGDKLGMSESSVRSKYNNAIGEKASQAEKIAATLKAEVDKKGMIDISEGANQVLGVSESKLDEAAYILEAEYGYQRYGVGIRQRLMPVSRQTLPSSRSLNLTRNMLTSIRIRSILWAITILMTAARPLRSFSALPVWTPVVLRFVMATKAVWIKTALWRFAVGFLTLILARAIMRRFASLLTATII